MKQKTYLASALDLADAKAQYDAQVKYILSDKGILARILKETVEELTPYSVEEIAAFIEGTPEIGTVPIDPGKTNQPAKIHGSKEEDAVPNEGMITYDIRFPLIIPGKQALKILLNIEAQKDFYPDYDLVTRGIFYCSRMISAQKDTEFSGSDYDGIKKVYSIWICMNAPSRAANTITKYYIEQDKVYGDFQGNARYDLMSLVFIGLGKETDEKKPPTALHRMLNIVLSTKRPEEKQKILEEEFQLPMSQTLEKEVAKMCNLSDLVEERGIARGKAEGKAEGRAEERARQLQLLTGLINDGILTIQEAAKRSGISETELEQNLSNIACEK